MNWSKAAVRLLSLAALAIALGALYGYPREALILLLLAWSAYGIVQMHRAQRWLNDAAQLRPDTQGAWGDLFARIYFYQRKHAEAQAVLQSTVDYLQDSFSAMRDGVVMVDEHGAIKWLNRAVSPLLGLRNPEDTGQTLTNLVRAPEFNEYFLARDYSKPLQFLSVSAGGAVYLRVDITAFGEGNRLLFIRDVSSEIRMEKMRTDFVANVSHELRTPLTVISGYLSTFLENTQDLPQRYIKPLQQMAQHAQRMENLVKDLLWLSRIENDTRDVEHEPLNVGELLQELKDDLAEAYPQATVELDIASDHTVQGDYQQLYSAVSNLAINAIKYSACDKPVTISWVLQDGSLRLLVRDQGIGIDSRHISRLTERFYRVDDSRSAATGGTGLGLAIVKHVAAAHGARLQIESKLGEGSTFTLIFPTGG